MIFEFKGMSQADAFVSAVKRWFGLDGQTFDDEEAAYEHDPFPFRQFPPLAHIDRDFDRPNWMKVERQVEIFGREFGGKFIGT
jgi:hypothetical protein